MNEQPIPARRQAVTPAGREHAVAPPLRMGQSEPAVDLAALQALRRFHLSGSSSPHTKPEGMIPALLWPFRHARVVRSEYPLVLPPLGQAARAHLPVADALERAMGSAFPSGGSGRILADNLKRLERCLRLAVEETTGVASFHEIFEQASKRLVDDLELAEGHRTQLLQDLATLAEQIPAGSRLLDFRDSSDLWLLLDAALAHQSGRREALIDEARSLVDRLKSLLLVDEQKGTGARTPERIARTMGAASPIDAARLSAVLGQHRGTETLGEPRRRRIEAAIATLRQLLDNELPQAVVIQHGATADLPFARQGVVIRDVADPLASAAGAFEEFAQSFAEIFRAMRVARLEAEPGGGKYEPLYHDAWLAGFDWSAFSEEEAQLLPAIVVVDSATDLADAKLGALSSLLRSGRRVTVLARVQPAFNPGSDGSRVSASYRLELGYLGISHREVVVHQSAAARPSHLHAGFLRALSTTRASLHIVATAETFGSAYGSVGPWLFSGASVESRAHPLFLYDPEGGTTWARRIDCSGNPEPEGDFPVYSVHFLGASGQPSETKVPFSFADFSLLVPELADHFAVVLPSCAKSDALVSVDEYLRLKQEEAIRKVPTIWAADADGQLHRLALSRELLFACRDRLGFWRTLQELAGVRNEHVEKAVARAVEAERAAAAKERGALEEAHRAELRQVRLDTASDALGKLASALISGESFSLGAASEAEASPKPEVNKIESVATEEIAEPDAEEAQGEPAEEDEGEEAWIDSALCTSCNDCVNLNSRMFVYNGNKQAELVDIAAGTFAQLVQAAERCPARCIHPGKPLNASEPNLDELVQRARPFN